MKQFQIGEELEIIRSVGGMPVQDLPDNVECRVIDTDEKWVRVEFCSTSNHHSNDPDLEETYSDEYIPIEEMADWFNFDEED